MPYIKPSLTDIQSMAASVGTLRIKDSKGVPYKVAGTFWHSDLGAFFIATTPESIWVQEVSGDEPWYSRWEQTFPVIDMFSPISYFGVNGSFHCVNNPFSRRIWGLDKPSLDPFRDIEAKKGLSYWSSNFPEMSSEEMLSYSGNPSFTSDSSDSSHFIVNLKDTDGNYFKDIDNNPLSLNDAIKLGNSYLGTTDDGHTWKVAEIENLETHEIVKTLSKNIQSSVQRKPLALQRVKSSALKELARDWKNYWSRKDPYTLELFPLDVFTIDGKEEGSINFDQPQSNDFGDWEHQAELGEKAREVLEKWVKERHLTFNDDGVDGNINIFDPSQVISSVKRTSLNQAVRPTTTAITKAVTGEIADDENSIRLFLQGKVPPASLDKAVALVMKYIPIVRSQQKKQNFATAGQIATNTNARVLPVGGEIQPAKKSLTGVTYHGWVIDKAIRTPGTFYAFIVGTNGPFTKAGFTSAQEALDWVKNVGEPSTFEGFVDTETINLGIDDVLQDVPKFSDEEKKDLYPIFTKYGEFEDDDLLGLTPAQKEFLRAGDKKAILKALYSSAPIVSTTFLVSQVQGVLLQAALPAEKRTAAQTFLKKLEAKYKGHEDVLKAHLVPKIEAYLKDLGLPIQAIQTISQLIVNGKWGEASRSLILV